MPLLANALSPDLLDKKALRAGFGRWILLAGEKYPNVVVLNADLPWSLKVGDFEKAYPTRYFQVGVAEQNMAGIGAGLASEGMIPFITSFAAFSPGLNYSQIRLAAMCHYHMCVVGSHYGFNTGEDGASAQMESDVAMMRALPGCVVIAPSDYNETIAAVDAICKTPGFYYLRVTRADFPVFLEENRFEIGKGEVLASGSDVTLVASGSMVYETLLASSILKDKWITCEVISMATVKPLDVATLISSAKKTGRMVAIEESNIHGGLGEGVARVLCENFPCPLLTIGMGDAFGESGSHRALWGKYGLDSEGIVRKVVEFLK